MVKPLRFGDVKTVPSGICVVLQPHGNGPVRAVSVYLKRLGRISKAGQADIRRLLISGAMSRLNWLGRKSIPETFWLARMVARKPWMLLAIALANKMARTIWALPTKNEDYQVPAQAVVA